MIPLEELVRSGRVITSSQVQEDVGRPPARSAVVKLFAPDVVDEAHERIELVLIQPIDAEERILREMDVHAEEGVSGLLGDLVAELDARAGVPPTDSYGVRFEKLPAGDLLIRG
jgi:hypothetical protein